MVNSSIPHGQLDLQASLQAVAIRISCQKAITVCSIYLPPMSKWTKNDLEDLINQLPPPVFLLGDFNAHSTEWGCSKNDSRGKMISDLMLQRNLSLLNDGSVTYLHSGSGSQSAVDLSICDPSLYLDFSWKVLDDLCGRDHFPAIIHSDMAVPSVTNSTWKLSKADCDTFSNKAASDLKGDCIINAADPVANFTDALCTIANSTIPKRKSKPVKLNTIWFNDECRELIKSRKKAQRKLSIQPTAANIEH